MENKEKEILSEIIELFDSIQNEMEMIREKIGILTSLPESEENGLDVIDIVELPQFDDDLPELQEPPKPEAEPVPAPEPEPEQVPEPEPEVKVVEEKAEVKEERNPEYKKKVAVVDAMLHKEAWRNDRPSSPVKDVRSAIALNDRILFINSLFKGDPEAFQNAISDINSMSTLDEAVNYLSSTHPEWKMGSDTVYRFMMAVRRKLE